MTSVQYDQAKYQHAISMLKNESLDLAVRKLQILSKEGDGHADAVLGALFEFGRGEIAVDKGKALSCYERSVASVGSLQGWMGIGRISLNGPPELRDYGRALECFSLVANQSNYPQAWLALGEIYMRGFGAKQDLEVAASCFQKAADLGNVFGYTGLARVAAKQRKMMRSIKYRAVAVIKALRVQKGSESLQPW
jgi:TPR repeat protein